MKIKYKKWQVILIKSQISDIDYLSGVISLLFASLKPNQKIVFYLGNKIVGIQTNRHENKPFEKCYSYSSDTNFRSVQHKVRIGPRFFCRDSRHVEQYKQITRWYLFLIITPAANYFFVAVVGNAISKRVFDLLLKRDKNRDRLFQQKLYITVFITNALDVQTNDLF